MPSFAMRQNEEKGLYPKIKVYLPFESYDNNYFLFFLCINYCAFINSFNCISHKNECLNNLFNVTTVSWVLNPGISGSFPTVQYVLLLIHSFNSMIF